MALPALKNKRSVRIPISKTGGAMKDRRKYTRKKKHKDRE